MRTSPAVPTGLLRESGVRAFWAILDSLFWVGAVLFTVWLRYSFDNLVVFLDTTVLAAALAGLFHIVAGVLFGPYLAAHIRGSFEEVVAVARAATLAGVTLLSVAVMVDAARIPRSVPVLAGGLALTLMLAARYVVRSYRARLRTNRGAETKVLVMGAGMTGRTLAHHLTTSDSKYQAVAFVDDDRSKRRISHHGVRVRGGRQDIPRLAMTHGATELFIAIRSADSTLLREVRAIASEADLRVKVLPHVDHMLAGEPRATDLRDLDLGDLLGRRPVRLDEAAIADHLSGKIVLVTGAGGSIGAELCRQISRFTPARLVMVERDETALHSVQLSLTGAALLQSDDLVLADIRDSATIENVFAEIRPDIVFHAAALKHLPLLERHPREGWQTNVLGTLNVLRAAAATGVGTFVNISTDKAAHPTSVLGYTKRVAERLTASFAANEPGTYVSVRFGNVLGSRGSVIPAFTEQIRRGGPVTVTHPDVERYFMLIPEACQLVMQATVVGEDGNVMVLDMGQPVRIAEVARTLIDMSSSHHVGIVYTGLRPGEKLTEDLFTPGERTRTTTHPLVSAVGVPGIDPETVRLQHFDSADDVKSWLARHAHDPDASQSQVSVGA